MSYVSGANSYTTVGVGTVQSGNGTATVTVTCNASTRQGDLVVQVLYATVDPGLARDTQGQGWKLLDSGFDSVNSYGLAIWAYVATQSAGTSRLGIVLETAGNWCAHTYTYRPAYPHLQWDLANAVGGKNWYNATADSRQQDWLPMSGAGAAINPAQGLTLLAAGCTNNASVLPTATAITNYTERLDSGVTAAPSMNVYLMDRTNLGQGAPDVYSTLSSTTFWSNTSARTKRASLRAFVPTSGNVLVPRRYMKSGRLG